MLKEISIEIIRKCPNNCVHCSSFSHIKRKEIIDLSIIIAMVNDAKILGATTICLSGGEPFLHPNIIEIVSHISSCGLECYIYTSGIMINKDDFCSLSKDVLSNIVGKVNKLIFNVEASGEAVYNKIMGTTGCFNLLKESIKKAVDLSIVAEAHFVPMKLNIHEIKETLFMCEQLGVSKISFLRLVAHGRAFENETELMLDESEMKYLKELLVEINKSSRLSLRVGVPFSDSREKTRCEAAKGKLNIKYDGSVFPCEVFKNDRVNLKRKGLFAENIKQKRLLDIYNNSEYLKFVRNYVETYTCNCDCENCVGQHLITKNAEV